MKYLNLLLGFLPNRYAKAIAYMLQDTGYSIKDFTFWLLRTRNFNTVASRRDLQSTKASRLVKLFTLLGYTLSLASSLVLIFSGKIAPGILILALSPILPVLLLVILISAGNLATKLVIRPIQRKQTEKIFSNHQGLKIAVLGSYGKTTVKELLAQALGAKFKTAYTPGNMNTSIAHHRFAKTLSGDEEMIIIEYGEEIPGDIAKYAKSTRPDIAVIAGLAPAHLDKLKTMDLAAKEILSIFDFVKPEDIYINSDSKELLSRSKGSPVSKDNFFNSQKALGWEVSNIKQGLSGLRFNLRKKQVSVVISSGLLGKHLAGSLALAASLGIKLGVKPEEVAKALSHTKAYKARLEPLRVGQSLIINDGYNGNIEGIRAGIELIKDISNDVKGKRIYATPGLIGQGDDSQAVHQEIGELAGKVFDKIYLIDNSNAPEITKGLERSKFKGQLELVKDPQSFYTNIESFLSAGDVILMQNDLPDAQAKRFKTGS